MSRDDRRAIALLPHEVMERLVLSDILPDRFPENTIIFEPIVIRESIALPMMDRIRDKDSIAMKRKDSRLRGLVFSAAAPAMVQEERLSLVSDRVHDADRDALAAGFLYMKLKHGFSFFQCFSLSAFNSGCRRSVHFQRLCSRTIPPDTHESTLPDAH